MGLDEELFDHLFVVCFQDSGVWAGRRTVGDTTE